MKLFVKHVSIFALAQMAAGLIAFAYSVVTARILGVTEYGLFQVLLSMNALALAFTLPLNFAVVHCAGVTEEKERDIVTGEFLKVAFLGSVSMVTLLLLAAPFLTAFFKISQFGVILNVGVLIIANALTTVFYGRLQGEKRFVLFSWIRVIQTVAVLILGVFLMKVGLSSSGAIAGYYLGMILVLVFFLSQSKMYAWQKGYSHIQNELKSVTWIVFCVWTVMMLDNIPMMMARGRLSEVMSGYYASVYNLRNAIWPLAYAVILPFYSHSLEKTQDETMMFRQAVRMLLFLGGGFVVVGLAFAKPLFHFLYGAKFSEASYLMSFYGVVILAEIVMLLLMFFEIAKGKMSVTRIILPLAVLGVALYLWGAEIEGLLAAPVLAAFSYFLIFALSDAQKPARP